MGYINVERKGTKTHRRKEKKKISEQHSLEIKRLKERRNRKVRQRNKLNSTDMNLKKSRQIRDLKRTYGIKD